MPRTSTIARHEKREEIARDIAEDKLSIRDIAQKYGVTKSAIEYFAQDIAGQSKAIEVARRYVDADTILRRLESWMVTTQKVVDACDEYLTDPEHPEKYTLGPRDTDITVIYETEEDSESGGDPDDEESHVKVTRKKVRKKALLSELIAGMPYIFSVHWKTADPRDLILKAVITGKVQLEMIARIIGAIKEGGATFNGPVQVNVLDGAVATMKALEAVPCECGKTVDARDWVRRQLIGEP